MRQESLGSRHQKRKEGTFVPTHNTAHSESSLFLSPKRLLSLTDVKGVMRTISTCQKLCSRRSSETRTLAELPFHGTLRTGVRRLLSWRHDINDYWNGMDRSYTCSFLRLQLYHVAFLIITSTTLSSYPHSR